MHRLKVRRRKTIKKVFDVLISILDMAEERISELEDP